MYDFTSNHIIMNSFHCDILLKINFGILKIVRHTIVTYEMNIEQSSSCCIIFFINTYQTPFDLFNKQVALSIYIIKISSIRERLLRFYKNNYRQTCIR